MKLSIRDMKWIVANIERIEEYDEFENHMGICSNLDWVAPILTYSGQEIVRHYCEDWWLYSGNPIYPIPSTNRKLNAEEYYDWAGNKWRGKQGDLRRSLCQHIANRIKAELEAL